ncbi:DUF4199 domain-containing protein [Marivirga sp.]|uniref:DUF4199 domain-containing protein n=1 Tax=Marivirga sp. TaxID=2018662 RepID=UPI002D7F138F|nr:DUF4199 domain-containing protein [Marivirga sp.]HET8858523.1 DUF4199 domain-containing protein [Marivirga sp.]
MENEEQENISQHAIKWGAILGLIAIIIMLTIYLIDITLIAKQATVIGIVTFVVYLFILIYSGRDYRSKLGGYMSFGKAFTHAFVVLAIASFIVAVFNYLLYNVIDPEIVPILVEAQMTNIMQTMEALGGGTSDIMDETAKGIKDSYTLAGQAKGFLFSLIGAVIGALIIGAINKKKNKEEEF